MSTDHNEAANWHILGAAANSASQATCQQADENTAIAANLGVVAGVAAMGVGAAVSHGICTAIDRRLETRR